MYGFYMTTKNTNTGVETLTSYVMDMQSTGGVYDTDADGNYIENGGSPSSTVMDFTPEAGNGYTQRIL